MDKCKGTQSGLRPTVKPEALFGDPTLQRGIAPREAFISEHEALARKYLKVAEAEGDGVTPGSSTVLERTGKGR